MIEAFLFILGMALLIAGAEFLVRGASSLAGSMGISPLVIGLTVVAFGTSFPEFAVNMTASLQGTSDISFGNIIGSNIANIGLILGCAALIRPLSVRGIVILREIPMMLLATGAVLIMGFDEVLTRTPSRFDRADGLLLLLLFCVFLYYTVTGVFTGTSRTSLLEETGQLVREKSSQGAMASMFITAAGLVMLLIGARLVVNASVEIARMAQIPEAVIALVLVAIGTSLPELATSILASAKGQYDIAMGNVVGSNIFNLLFILGTSSSIRPCPVPSGGYLDLAAMAVFSLILLPFSMTGKHTLSRFEGGVLLGMYLLYILYRVIQG